MLLDYRWRDAVQLKLMVANLESLSIEVIYIKAYL